MVDRNKKAKTLTLSKSPTITLCQTTCNSILLLLLEKHFLYVNHKKIAHIQALAVSLVFVYILLTYAGFSFLYIKCLRSYQYRS